MTKTLESQAREILERYFEYQTGLGAMSQSWMKVENAEKAVLEALTYVPPVMDDERFLLTTEFVNATPLQKWGLLLVNGILGTDEPWIEDMRAALQDQERRIAEMEYMLTLPDATNPEDMIVV